jgi:pyrimidine-nucleoside phosphorylase
MIEAQGGDTRAFDDRALLPTATVQRPVLADSEGVVSQLDALTIARASILLGAGRERKDDPIDLAVGVRLEAKIGDRVGRGQPIAVLHANDESRLPEAERVLRGGIQLSTTPVAPPPVILERLGASVASRA